MPLTPKKPMLKILPLLLILTSISCTSQNNFTSSLESTSDLEKFENLSKFKESLEGVEIIALGENTHGLGEVFSAKAELVKFLHEELGFDLVLFESGYGDAALAWERMDSFSSREFTNHFSSNFYYHSEEIEQLVDYVKSRNGALKIMGIDCQPQQNFLIKQMEEIAWPLDSLLANSVPLEMKAFNYLYQYENDGDTLAFNQQRDRFIRFLDEYNLFLNKSAKEMLNNGVSEKEMDAMQSTFEIFRNTYSNIQIGYIMSWPESENVRDKAMFEIVKTIKASNPGSKIIIWAQNSHIENTPKPNYTVNWMGHQLKNELGDKYYSVGAVVYSGTNLNYNGTFEFEHKDKEYLAYHLNQFQKEKYVLDLRNYDKNEFTHQLLLGMENNGNTAEFIAKDRFDGLLFLKYSDVPKLLEKD
jgi:erythromycin esterase